jgi:hypothetical protein
MPSVQQPLSMEAPPSPLSSERSRGICSSADLSWKCFSTERTRVSCCAAADTAACAAFPKESRMKLAESTKCNRKSGGSVVEGPAVFFFTLRKPHPSGCPRIYFASTSALAGTTFQPRMAIRAAALAFASG